MKITATSARSWAPCSVGSWHVSALFRSHFHALPLARHPIRWPMTPPYHNGSSSGPWTHEMKLRSLTSQDAEETTCNASIPESSGEALVLREAPHEGPIARDDLEGMAPRMSHQAQSFRRWFKIFLLLSASLVLVSLPSQPAFASAAAEGSGFSIAQALKGNAPNHDTTVPFMSYGLCDSHRLCRFYSASGCPPELHHF